MNYASSKQGTLQQKPISVSHTQCRVISPRVIFAHLIKTKVRPVFNSFRNSCCKRDDLRHRDSPNLKFAHWQRWQKGRIIKQGQIFHCIQ